MFEKFDLKARRVIFFARYYASLHGSAKIQPGHMVLALVRENPELMRQFGKWETIIEKAEMHIDRAAPYSTSCEIPLDAECKKVINATERLNPVTDRDILSAIQKQIPDLL